MPRGRKGRFTHVEFIEVWNASETLAQVAERLKITKGDASVRASHFRKQYPQWTLKDFSTSWIKNRILNENWDGDLLP